MASCCTHARMHDAARATRVAAGARRAGPCMHAHMCTDVRVTVGCAHGYLGQGCLHAWHVCVSPAPSVCHVYGRKEQGHTHTHAHIHTCAPSHGKGGGDHIFPAAALCVDQTDEFFRVPAHTHHTRPGSSLVGASTCATCEAGKYSNATGASRECLLRCPPSPPRSLACVDMHAYACVHMCRGSQWHPAACMRVCVMQREQEG